MADVITVTAGSAGQAGSTAAELITYMSARLLEVAELNTILDQFGGMSPNVKFALNTLEVQKNFQFGGTKNQTTPSNILGGEISMDNQRQADELNLLTGFFAGEGSIYIRKSQKKSKTPTLYVDVGNTERMWCDKFQQRFGGRVRVSFPKRANALPYYHWITTDENAGDFLRTIAPNLIGEKRQQLEIALKLEAIKAKKPNRGRAGVNGHFSVDDIAAMNRIEEELRECRCAAAETKRANAMSMRSDSPTPQVTAANKSGQTPTPSK